MSTFALPHIDTLGSRQFYAFLDYVSANRIIGMVTADTQEGKSYLIGRYASAWAGPAPAGEVKVRQIAFLKLRDILELFAQGGLMRDPPSEEDRYLVRRRCQADMEEHGARPEMPYWSVRDPVDEHPVRRETVATWVTDLAKVKGVKIGGELRRFAAIAGAPNPRIPLIYVGDVDSSPAYVRQELLLLVTGELPRGVYWKQQRCLLEHLEAYRIFLIIDEADLPPPRTLQYLRGLHDKAGIPICFVGTRRLLHRVSRDPDLRAVRDRVGHTFTLKSPTFEEVREALPEYSDDVVAAMWERTGKLGPLRHLVALIRQAQANRPSLRVDRRLVNQVVKRLLSAKGLPHFTSRDTELDVGDLAVPEAAATAAPGRADGITRKRAAAR